MNAYLENTKFAVQSVITAYTREFHELNKQIALYQEAVGWMRTPNEEVEKTSMERMEIMAKMFAQCREASLDINRLSSALKDRELSTQALCGSLLQIAKQGISTGHHDRPNCPNGRLIRSQAIRDVIWYGRNQAMHYDDVHGLRPPTIACFQQLDADFGRTLSASVLTTNLATCVIDILGWHAYEAYEKDMTTLLP